MEKVRRTKYLIDKKLQLRFTYLVVALIVVYSLFLGGATYINYKISCMVFDSTSMYDPAVEQAIKTEGRKTVITTSVFLVINGCVIAAVFVLLTHKVAGPLYRINKQITVVRDGKLPKKMTLRKGDELQSLADSFNEMTEALRETTRKEIEELKGLGEDLKKATAELKSAGASAATIKEIDTVFQKVLDSVKTKEEMLA